MLICLYFVTMVTTTTGYGMMVPKYPIEKLLVQGLCLWGIIFYSIITAQITSYLINIVGSQFEWRQRMYVREQHLQWLVIDAAQLCENLGLSIEAFCCFISRIVEVRVFTLLNSDLANYRLLMNFPALSLAIQISNN